MIHTESLKQDQQTCQMSTYLFQLICVSCVKWHNTLMLRVVFSVDVISSLLNGPGGTWPMRHHQAGHFLAALAAKAPKDLTRSSFVTKWENAGATEPDRTAMRRVIIAVQDALARAGSASRVRLLPRKATVGPWRFDIGANEEWRVIDGAVALPRPRLRKHAARLGLTHSHTPASILSAISVITVADELARRAQYAEALEHLAEHAHALDLSAEAQASLALRRARWLRRTGAVQNAGSALQEAQILALAAHVDARGSLLAECATLRARLQYDADPLASAKTINFARLAEQVEEAGSPQLRWELGNLQALTIRRRIENMLGGDQVAQASQLSQLAEQAGRAFNVAFYWLLVASDPYHLQAVLVNYAHHLQWLGSQDCAAIAAPEVADIVTAWRISQLVMEKFDLPEDSAWDYIMFADLWLGSTKARVLIGADWRLWPKSRSPATDDFYLHASELARQTGDAGQQVFVWDRRAAFHKATGHLKEAIDALHSRDALFDHHPGLAERLASESFYAPLPGQKRFAAVIGMAAS